VAGTLGGGWGIALAGTAGGLAGSLVDSLLGATVQAMYFCPACQKETERHPTHACGARTDRIRGWSWLGNDAVNFAATAFGALLAIGISALFRGSPGP
jgi:uncharacterized membrane protein